MDGLEFRAATRSDLPDMAHLFTKRPPEERQERMSRRYELEPSGWYLAVLHGRVVGCCQAVFPRDGDAWLQWMRIDPEVQNSGVGGRFIDYVEERAVARGARALRLSTLSTNGRVHYLMGGLRGYTEWARWTRLEDLKRKAVRERVVRHDVQRAEDADEVMDWLVTQPGFHAAFEAVTCPTDFRKFVTLDWRLLAELIGARGRRGCMVARMDDEMEGVALYAVNDGELRVLQ
ncbi:MAG: GNAT family N-acetyltransferase, partial [Tumebacillaceae bacterium]